MRTGIWISIMVLLLPLCCVHTQAWCEETTRSPVSLTEIVVKGKSTVGFTEAERKATTNDVVFDEETIKNSTSQTVSEFLAQQGYTVTQPPTQYDSAGVTIRGVGSTGAHSNEASASLLFFVNGRRAGITNINQLSMQNVERIEIVRGPEMYKFSAASTAGVINIITKRGGPDRFSGSIETGYGSYDNYKTTVTLNGLVKNFDYSGDYTYNSIRKDYKDGHNVTVANSRTDDINSFNINAGYTLNKRHRIGFESSYYDVSGAHRPQYIDELTGETIAPGIMDRNYYTLAATYEGSTEDNRFAWDASIGMTHDYFMRQTEFTKFVYGFGQQVDSKQGKVGLSYKSNMFDLAGGMDYIEYITKNSGTPNSYYPIGVPMHHTHTSQFFGAYLVGTLKLMENTLNLSGALRYDYGYLEDDHIGDEPYFNSRRGTYYDEFKLTGTRPTTRSFDHISPSFGISYLPLKWLKLRANYTQSYQIPSGRHLFSSDISEGYGASGDPRMKAVKGDSYEAGFDIAWKDLKFSAGYFYNELEDPIVFRVLHHVGAKGANPQNAQKQKFAGIEVGTSMNLAPALGYKSFELRPFVNLTYMTLREELVMPHSFNGWAGHWMPARGVPDLTMNYGVSFHHFNWRLTANLNFNYFGGCDNMGAATKIDPILYEKYGHFTVANFSMTKELWRFTDKQNLKLKMYINNIFDEYYSYSYNPSYYMQGRNFYAGLIYSF